ncbi:cyclic di-GMP regulator CdgR [Salmonella enterica subsp. arizonae]|nr:cyclic di-GMP regulator CdgR [Salmonella enterica subsp. arizonae]
MIASLDELYHSELFFLPAMDKNARLAGLEIIATFATEDGAVRMPTELVVPRLSVEEQYCLFVEKTCTVRNVPTLFYSA